MSLKKTILEYEYYLQASTDRVLGEKPNPYMVRELEIRILESYKHADSATKLKFENRLPEFVRNKVLAPDLYKHMLTL